MLGMNMPGAVAPQNFSYTPAPMAMPGVPAPQAFAAAPAAQPIWQPGMPLTPNMSLTPNLPQASLLPQAAATPQFAAPQFMGAAVPQMGFPSYTPFPGQQITETIAAPAPVVAEQIVQPQFVQAMTAPAMVEQPVVAETVAAAPAQVQYMGAAPTYEQVAAKPMAYGTTTVLNPFLDQVRMPSVPTTVAPGVAYAGANLSYLPAPVQQTASYIPAAPMVAQATQPQVASYVPAPQFIEAIAQPQVASYIPAPQVIETFAQPQVSSYIPAPQVVETFAQPQVASYTPAIQPQVVETMAPQVTYATAAPTATVVETLAPGMAPTVMAAPGSYIPAPVVETYQAGASPVVSYLQPQAVPTVVEAAAPSGQSVIVEQVGDWLVCEDALGIFYHHTPTQQSFDNAPSEFLMLFPGGYTPPPLGAFQAAGYSQVPQMANVVQEVAYAAPSYTPAPVAYAQSYATGFGQELAYATMPQVTYGAPQVVETIGAGIPQVSSYIPAPQVTQMVSSPMVTYGAAAPVEQMMGVSTVQYGAPTVMAAPTMMTAGQLPTVMAKVLN